MGMSASGMGTAASCADTELARGLYRGPLHGLPWSAKDLLAVKGYPTTWGAAPYKDQRFDYDATVVQRLDAAGAVLIAKATMGALAMGDIWFGGGDFAGAERVEARAAGEVGVPSLARCKGEGWDCRLGWIRASSLFLGTF